MKEFWLWMIIVTLIIFGLMLLSFGLAYNHKQIKETKVILQRVEQLEKEKKREKSRIDPVDAD
jgi:hypothetical protein